MGGRVAEEIVFRQKTTGAGNDIERATELARSMVTEWGMSDEFGPLNFSSGKQEVFPRPRFLRRRTATARTRRSASTPRSGAS